MVIFMINKRMNMVYALCDDELVNISQVCSGLKCNCVCPACGSKLVARKGEKKIHHFAHYNTEECEYGYETSLHLGAKQILLEAKEITLPDVYLRFPNSHKEKELISPAQRIKIDTVVLEKGIDDIIPDVIIKVNDKFLMLEIFVTHRIDDIKLNKIRKIGISTIEIDFSRQKDIITYEKLKETIINGIEDKEWIYNSLEEKYYRMFVDAGKQMKVFSRGFAQHVDGCPISIREYRGKSYANFTDDCLYCEFCISYEENLLCSGMQKISKIVDFSRTKDERDIFYYNKYSKQKFADILNDRCPNCGGKLIIRNGKYGEFKGCSNYPHCRFILNVDKDTGEVIMKS